MHKHCEANRMDLLFSVMDNENDLTLTDNKGIVIRVSDSYEKNFQVTREEIIGRSVYDLERDGVFTPSVTAVVLREKRRATIMQRNKAGVYGLTTGVPILDGDGGIEYVISFNSVDIANVYSIYDKYSRLSELMKEYNSEIHFLKMRELGDKELIAKSKPMRDVKDLVAHIANTNANVLLTGETGVGKSLLAKTIHKYSNRSTGPFISINCSAIPTNLLESELFGYEKGAFTGAGSKGKPGKIELANEGTLFLDEIGDLSPEMQIKLLHVIQEKSLMRVGGLKKIDVDFRLISATNRDLRKSIGKGQFREDLFYRLNVIPIHIPPLRERPDDIVPLIAWFLSVFNGEYGTNVSFDPTVYEILENQTWNGNIRQVENLVERIVVTAKKDIITPEMLPPDLMSSVPFKVPPGMNRLKDLIEVYEKEIFLDAYRKYRTSIAVGKALGVSQATAARRLRRYVPEYKENKG
jgi:transcriptional regulator with PAS, ATPase and Fis domain